MNVSTPTLPTDQTLAAEQDQAQSDLVKSLTATTKGDMASLMARYGTQLALAGGGVSSPLVAPTPFSPTAGVSPFGQRAA